MDSLAQKVSVLSKIKIINSYVLETILYLCNCYVDGL